MLLSVLIKLLPTMMKRLPTHENLNYDYDTEHKMVFKINNFYFAYIRMEFEVSADCQYSFEGLQPSKLLLIFYKIWCYFIRNLNLRSPSTG